MGPRLSPLRLGSLGDVTDGPDDLAFLAQSLDRVEAALFRLDAGTYGTCDQCDQPMDAASLERDPASTVCTSCTQTRIDG